MKVYLHVGHGKTGSSFIQNVLAHNTSTLLGHGFYYPETHRVQAARFGNITSGNYFANEIIKNFDQITAEAPTGANLLFSSEHLFKDIPEKSNLLEFLHQKGVETHALLFIRDPVAALPSHYSQAVKRDGFSGTIDDYIKDIDDNMTHAARLPLFVDACEKSGVDLKVRNYERHKADVIATFEDFLEIPTATLEKASQRINRSLAPSEIDFVRYVNAIFGAPVGQRIADRLCMELPNAVVERVFPSAHAFKQYLQTVQYLVERYDTVADGTSWERYDIDFQKHFQKADKRKSQSHQLTPLTEEQSRIVREILLVEQPRVNYLKKIAAKVIGKFR